MKKLLMATIIGLVCLMCLSAGGRGESPRYEHKDPAFTFEYPSGYKAEPFQAATEVARLAADNVYKVPVLVAHVTGKEKNFNPADIPQNFAARMKKTTPGVSGFELLEQKDVKLTNGNNAWLVRMKWKWIDGITSIDTVLITALKEDKVITLTGTAFTDQNLMDEILKWCMTLNLAS